MDIRILNFVYMGKNKHLTSLIIFNPLLFVDEY